MMCQDEPNEPTKEGPLSYVFQESPFASVSTVNRGHTSLVALVYTELEFLKSLWGLGTEEE
jgi:hypothetical protein